MARPKSAFRNEMKARVPDAVYEGVKAFQLENQIDSESRAISRLLEIALFGTVGTVPAALVDGRHEMAHSRPGIRA